MDSCLVHWIKFHTISLLHHTFRVRSNYNNYNNYLSYYYYYYYYLFFFVCSDLYLQLVHHLQGDLVKKLIRWRLQFRGHQYSGEILSSRDREQILKVFNVITNINAQIYNHVYIPYFKNNKYRSFWQVK